jgi:N-acetyl sugar amidotransferase
VRYCARCLYPENHPLHLTFDADGVCSGCRVHEEKDRLDWRARRDLLRGILDEYRHPTGANYDCIVPVSGARDSYFIVDLLKREFAMNPLLVSYNRHYNTRLGIRNLAYLRTLTDSDYVQQTVQPQVVKRVIRETLQRIGSFHWHVLAGQSAYPVQTAVRLKIPLIVWGVHQGCDQVGMYSHLDEIEMSRKYRCEHDLMRLEAEDMIDGAEGLSEAELHPWFYPQDQEIERVGVRGIYLSNYIRWDTKAQHEKMLDRYGYETASPPRTFDTYNDPDCQHYGGLHDLVKFMKWGYGKVTDHATREIRLRRMTRAEGINLVRRYSTVPPPDEQRFLSWAGIGRDEFHAAINRFRDPRIWRKEGSQWVLADSVVNHAGDAAVTGVALGKIEECGFRTTPSKAPDADEDSYVLLHRGYVDTQTTPQRSLRDAAMGFSS